MTPIVRTLTGDVPPETLGRTLIREHLVLDWGEMLGRPKVIDFDYAAMVNRIVTKMDALAAVGIGAMTECTPYGCGRYFDLYRDGQVSMMLEENPHRVLAFAV
ncbi:MAG: hypothetical protein M3069_22835 [Chloroflexota bacterium]|nr:hypothetical protein [Chloroflexota bacterium]